MIESIQTKDTAYKSKFKKIQATPPQIPGDKKKVKKHS
jgi:hypothetical protein